MEFSRIDAIEAPEFFFQHVELEDAGDGNIRQIRYIKRRGVLIPAVSTISSAATLFRACDLCRDFSLAILQKQALEASH